MICNGGLKRRAGSCCCSQVVVNGICECLFYALCYRQSIFVIHSAVLCCAVPPRRFYLLFQQHCRYDNATTISKTMGEYSYHMVGA